ncbi:alcohol dehydrogenase catalytic domain-containing protein [Candidatus Pelagibacter sp.]|nr:alcohol dehydrogenase catalytic domain-containing protein [Candidatus Pelagibacter sp.]
MKSIQIEKFGGPEVFVIKDMDIGKPGPKEVLIKNKSIGLNFIDVYHRTGLYPIPLPSGIGLEASGVIEEIGSDVKLFKVGDRVTHASMPIGAYSEKQIMPIAVKVVSEDEYQEWLSEARVKFAKEEIENDKLKLASK